MNWLTKLLPKISTDKKKGVPEGVWDKCLQCQSVLYQDELKRNLMVCPKCSYHFRISARRRADYFLDPEGREEIGMEILPVDRLGFKDSKKYKDRLSAAQKQSGEKEAIIILKGKLNGLPIVTAFFNFFFIGGSMSAAVGERFIRGVEEAIKENLPLIAFSCSGGARMQESLFSLFQMSKTAAALKKLADQQLPYFSVLTDPTTGGVSASLATLGDLIIAEPGALIGFSGPRVIEQTIRQKLPEDFQRSEFLLEHGAIDMIVDRRKMREKIHQLLLQVTHKNQQKKKQQPSEE